MPKTIVVTQVTNPVRAGERAHFTCAVANTDATPARLTSLTVAEATRGGAQVSQPNFRAPNSGIDDYPTLGVNSTTQYGFSVVFNVPPTAGPNPNNEPGGAAPRQPAFPVYPLMQMQIVGQTSDGTAFTTPFSVAVLSAVRQTPQPGRFNSLIAAIT